MHKPNLWTLGQKEGGKKIKFTTHKKPFSGKHGNTWKVVIIFNGIYLFP